MAYKETDFVKNLRRKIIENDITNEQTNAIARAIDNEIIKEMIEKYGLES